MKAENFIELIEQKRFDKISRNGMLLIAKRFRELEKQILNLPVVAINEVELAELKEKYNQKCLQKIHIQKEYEIANKILIDNGLRESPIKINPRGA